MVNPDPVHATLHAVKEAHLLTINGDGGGGVPGVPVLVVARSNGIDLVATLAAEWGVCVKGGEGRGERGEGSGKFYQTNWLGRCRRLVIAIHTLAQVTMSGP